MLLTVISRRVGGGASQPYLTFTYDGKSQRVRKYNHFTGATTLYFGEVYEVRNEEPIIHLFANNQRIVSIHADGRMQYYHGNHLHSASVITEGYGNTKETIEYHPYGTYRLRTDLDASFPNVNYTFTDQEEDDEAGLYNYKARLYDPLLGRFISADSIVPEPGNLQAYNRYSYCLNNPVVYSDPSGHFFGVDDWVAGMIIGAIIGAVFAGSQSDWNLQAMAVGAVIGGAGGGLGVYVGGAVNSALAGVVQSAAISGAISGAAGGVAAGALVGGLSAVYYGGDIGESMLFGAEFGALGGAAFGAVGFPNNPWKVGAYTAIGGGLSELSGSGFGQGALMAGGIALMAYGYYKFTDIGSGNGGRLPKGDVSDGTAIRKTGDPVKDMAIMDANRNKNYFTSGGKTPSELNSPYHEGARGPRWWSSHTPFLNDISYAHDFGWARIFGNTGWNMITNYGSMLPAAAFTLGGAAAYYAPVTSAAAFGMQHE